MNWPRKYKPGLAVIEPSFVLTEIFNFLIFNAPNPNLLYILIIHYMHISVKFILRIIINEIHLMSYMWVITLKNYFVCAVPSPWYTLDPLQVLKEDFIIIFCNIIYFKWRCHKYKRCAKNPLFWIFVLLISPLLYIGSLEFLCLPHIIRGLLALKDIRILNIRYTEAEIWAKKIKPRVFLHTL